MSSISDPGGLGGLENLHSEDFLGVVGTDGSGPVRPEDE